MRLRSTAISPVEHPSRQLSRHTWRPRLSYREQSQRGTASSCSYMQVNVVPECVSVDLEAAVGPIGHIGTQRDVSPFTFTFYVDLIRHIM